MNHFDTTTNSNLKEVKPSRDRKHSITDGFPLGGIIWSTETNKIKIQCELMAIMLQASGEKGVAI